MSLYGINRTAPGTDTVAVGEEDGSVFLIFQQPVQWVKLDPATALAVGQEMAKLSYKAKFGDVPDVKRGQLVEQLRIKLRNRITIMLRGFSNAAPVPPYEVQAMHVVDACLKEAA